MRVQSDYNQANRQYDIRGAITDVEIAGSRGNVGSLVDGIRNLIIQRVSDQVVNKLSPIIEICLEDALRRYLEGSGEDK